MMTYDTQDNDLDNESSENTSTPSHFDNSLIYAAIISIIFPIVGIICSINYIVKTISNSENESILHSLSSFCFAIALLISTLIMQVYSILNINIPDEETSSELLKLLM